MPARGGIVRKVLRGLGRVLLWGVATISILAGIGLGIRAAFLADGSRYHARPRGANYLYTTTGVAVSPDGSRIAVTDGSRTYVLDAASGERICEIWARRYPVMTHGHRPVAFSPNGQRLAVATREKDTDDDDNPHGRVSLLDAGTGAELVLLGSEAAFTDNVVFQTIDAGTRILAARGVVDPATHTLGQGRIVAWDADTGTETVLVATEPAALLSVADTGDGALAFLRVPPDDGDDSQAPTLVLRDRDGGERSIPLPRPGRPRAVLPDPTGQVLAVSFEDTGRVVLMSREGKPLRTINAGLVDVAWRGAGAFLDDGRLFAHPCAADAGPWWFRPWTRTVCLTDVATGALHKVLPVRWSKSERYQVRGVAADPAGKTLVAGFAHQYAGDAAVWDRDARGGS